jgi:hypothetical protein
MKWLWQKKQRLIFRCFCGSFIQFLDAFFVVLAIAVIAIVGGALLPLKAHESRLRTIDIDRWNDLGLDGSFWISSGGAVRNGIPSNGKVSEFNAKFGQSNRRTVENIPVNCVTPDEDPLFPMPSVRKNVSRYQTVDGVHSFRSDNDLHGIFNRKVELRGQVRRKGVFPALDEHGSSGGLTIIRPIQFDLLRSPVAVLDIGECRPYTGPRKIQERSFGIPLNLLLIIRDGVQQISESDKTGSEYGCPTCDTAEYAFPPLLWHGIAYSLFLVEIPSFISCVACLRWLLLYRGKWKALLGAFLSAAICCVTIWGMGIILFCHP